jgi:hypothetical protein
MTAQDTLDREQPTPHRDLHRERGTRVADIPLHRDPYFSRWSLGGSPGGDRAALRAMRRLKYDLTKRANGAKATVDDVLISSRLSECTALATAANL